MNIKKGSIIQRELGGLMGAFYKHIGIYIGGGKVIHFSGVTKKQKGAKIVCAKIEEFADGKEVSVRAEPKNDKHADAVVKEAKRILASEANRYNGKYDFAFNNCEDFAVRCYEVEY